MFTAAAPGGCASIVRPFPQNVQELKPVPHHQQHNRMVTQSVWARRLAYVAIFCAVAVLVFTLLSG
ncbi:MAG: hypothetical protein R3C44_07995 [Chloroflexota bacterium]